MNTVTDRSPARRAGVALTGAVAALLLLSGCGSGGAADSAPATAENYLHALAENDAEAACLMMADLDEDYPGPVTEKSAEWHFCLSLIGRVLMDDEGFGRYAEAEVEVADIDGDTASVDADQINGVVDPDVDLELKLFDGKWYVVDL